MTVQFDSHGEGCWKIPSHYWCASKKIEQLKAENERLTGELLRIGDMAVANWDDHVVGEVTRTGVKPTMTYIEMLRAELKQWQAMRDFIGDEMARSDYKSVAEMRADLATQNKVVVFLRAEIDRLKAEKLANLERRLIESIRAAQPKEREG